MSTMEKEAILQKCRNTFVPHCVNAKLCYCTQVKPCMTMILTEITEINDIIMLLAVTTGLEITAGQRTMSRLIEELTSQLFVLPVMLTGQNRSY